MSDSPKPSRWNSLLESLGLPTPGTRAAPPPKPRRRKPVCSTAAAAREASRQAESRRAGRRSWGSIAGESGSGGSARARRSSSAAIPPASPTPVCILPPPAGRTQRPIAEPSPALESPPAAARTPLDDIFGEQSGDVDVFGLSSGREERAPYSPPPAQPRWRRRGAKGRCWISTSIASRICCSTKTFRRLDRQLDDKRATG